MPDTNSSSKTVRYTVKMDYNDGKNNEKEHSENEYESDIVTVDLTKYEPSREGYEFSGWYYLKSGSDAKLIENASEVKLQETFGDDPTPNLIAAWTQIVNVTVDDKTQQNEGNIPYKVGDTIQVATPTDSDLTFDKWIVNGSEKNPIIPTDAGASIEIKGTTENYVTSVSGETGYGITSTSPKAEFVSYWSPATDYLVQVKNETGHPLKFSDDITILNDAEQLIGIMAQLPDQTADGYFTITNTTISTTKQDYIKWKDQNVKCTNIRIGANDVKRNIKISFAGQNGVTYSSPSNSIELANSGKLSVKDLLGETKAKRAEFERYRWTYKVKPYNGDWIDSDKATKWNTTDPADNLNNTFIYEFPYYEFQFTPVWQSKVSFETGFPKTETTNLPTTPDVVYQDEKSTFTEFPELTDSRKRYAFAGWKLKGDTSDTIYKKESDNSQYTLNASSATFVGQWEAIGYPIYWKLGYTDEVLEEKNIEYGKDISFPTDPTRTGYTFLGWKMTVGEASTDAGTEVSEKLYKSGDTVTMPAGVVTMTAQWQINTYTVTYDGNGTTIGVYSKTDEITYGTFYSIKQENGIRPTRFGYEFLGWKMNNHSELLQPGDSFSMPAEKVVLTAQWKPKSPNLSNKGTHDLSHGVKYTHDGAFRIKGDPNNYQDKITFYVPDDGEFTFE